MIDDEDVLVFLKNKNPPIYDPYLLLDFKNFLYSRMKEKIISDYLNERESHKNMIEVAEQYFKELRNDSRNLDLESKLNELIIEYSDDPAFCALLKLEKKSLDK